MIIHNVEQGTPEWQALRLGIPTASEFDKIVTPTGKYSAQSRTYMYRLAAERFLCRPLDEIGDLFWVRRGKELEPQAAAAYEFDRNIETRTVGFVTSNSRRVGASPDRLIAGEPGGVELKCPAPATHVGYLVNGFERAYWHQVQGQMLVCELNWIDRVSYYPGLPLVIERCYRDEEYIAKLDAALIQFCDELDELTEILRRKGAVEYVAPAKGDEA